MTHALPVKDLQRNRQPRPRENNTSVLDVLEGTVGEGEEKTRAVAGERVKPRHARSRPWSSDRSHCARVSPSVV